jgi:hypothetical protein
LTDRRSITGDKPAVHLAAMRSRAVFTGGYLPETVKSFLDAGGGLPT